MTKKVSQLFSTSDELSAQSAQILSAPDLGAQIQAGLGVDVDDVEASEVVLVTIMADDSSSISYANNEQNVRDGHNLVLDSLLNTKQKDGILIHTRLLNGAVIYPYVAIDQADTLNKSNYNANGMTPLYDQMVVLLGTVLAKTQEFVENGVPCRSITLVLTDGEDQGSMSNKINDVKSLVDDMLGSENHIIAAFGVDNGNTNFQTIFEAMGIQPNWILTPSNNAKEVREAFRLFSQSAIRASQGAATFSQTAAGGFGAN